MDYYEVPNSLTGVPRKVILHKSASDLEEACLLAGLGVADVGQLDIALRRCYFLMRELLIKGYQVRLPFGTFKGRLSTEMEYSVAFKLETTLQENIAGAAVFTKVERPSNFIATVSTVFQSAAGNTSHAVMVRGVPFTVKGKFTYATNFHIASEDGTESPLTQITKSSSSVLCRLDTPLPIYNGKVFVGNSLGNELAIPYSVLKPVFLDAENNDLIAIIPYIGTTLGGKTESDFYTSTANSLGLSLVINASRTTFTFKLLQKVGLVQTDASLSQVVYPATLVVASGVYYYIDFGVVGIVGVHRANLMAYLNDVRRYTGFVKFFGA